MLSQIPGLSIPYPDVILIATGGGKPAIRANVRAFEVLDVITVEGSDNGARVRAPQVSFFQRLTVRAARHQESRVR
jgi:hypothetical protein